MKVRNTTNTTLGLPNAKPVAAGVTVEISSAVAHNRIVAAWIAKGMLVVEDDRPKAEPAQTETESDGGMDKDAIIAELARYEVYRDKRASLANLEALLAEVRAEHEDA